MYSLQKTNRPQEQKRFIYYVSWQLGTNYILSRSVSKLIRFCRKVHQLDLFRASTWEMYIRRSVPLMLPSTGIHVYISVRHMYAHVYTVIILHTYVHMYIHKSYYTGVHFDEVFNF